MPKTDSAIISLPWYRYGIVWLVWLLPAIAVAASLTTLYIAAQNQPQITAQLKVR